MVVAIGFAGIGWVGSSTFTQITETQRVIVTFSNPISTQDSSFIHSLYGKELFKYRVIPAIAIELPKANVNKLGNNRNIKSFEVDGKVTITDIELDNSWGVKQIGAGIMHDVNVVGSGVKVAVIDTGIDYTHSELASIYSGGYDFVNNDANPMDDNGHGTHCAGIIAAANNGIGVVGVAPSIQLYAIKVLDSSGMGWESQVIAGIDWCISNNIQITSNSYGGDRYSDVMNSVFQIAWESGILSIAAAGNSGGSNTTDVTNYPARYTSVVAVAATDLSKSWASFSSTGPATEISAPGVNINSTYLGDSYNIFSGTSMACPHVAGVAALVKSAHPDWNNNTIRGQLRASANDLGIQGHNWFYGFGLVNAPMACGPLILNPPIMPDLPPEPVAQTIVTDNVVNVTDTTATFNGHLVSLGSSNSVAVYFAYGPYTPPVTYCTRTPDQTLTNPTFVTASVNGLQPNTLYMFAVGSLGNNGKYAYGDWLYFQTLPIQPSLTPSPSPIPTATPIPTPIPTLTPKPTSSPTPSPILTPKPRPTPKPHPTKGWK